MTDDTPPVRDASGRFVKRATETVNALSRTSDEGIHPMAKVLFGWTEAKGIGTILLCLTGVLSVLLILADLLVDRHETINAAGLFGFYGLFGFAALGFVLLAGWPLGSLLRRDEDYYADGNTSPADIDPETAEPGPGNGKSGGGA
jgi:hypothetical protein